jgi:hypothetical protein
MATDVFCLFILLSSLIKCVFPFPPSKAQFLGDVPKNRRNTANMFASVLNYVCFLCNVHQ